VLPGTWREVDIPMVEAAKTSDASAAPEDTIP
jgi:hypothetical protein